MFIGINLGGWEQKTTGVCILFYGKRNKILSKTKTIYGKNIYRTLSPYLLSAKVICIDAPLTLGQGKGKMKLFEKYLSQKFFRKHDLQPVPPAVIPQISHFASDLVKFLSKKGFILNGNLIETSPKLLKFVLKKKYKKFFETKDEEDAYYCSFCAFLHQVSKTFWIGYLDGKLFLPLPQYWLKKWWRLFIGQWQKRHPFRYKYLVSNIPMC